MNPYSVAPVATFPCGPGQTPDNLTGLPSGAALGLGVVGTTQIQYADDLVGPLQIKTGATAGGVVSLYLVVSEDGVTFSDGVDPSSTSDQSSKITSNTPLVETLNVIAGSTLYYFNAFSVFSRLGYMPSFWAVVVQNLSGSDFDNSASNFIANHSLVSYA